MSKVNKAIPYAALLISSLLVSSISWASSEMGGLSAFFASMTTGTIQSSAEDCINPYIACANSDTCPRWTKICQKCTNYNPVQYCGEVMPVTPDSINTNIDNPTTVTITWRPVLNATSYTVYIGDSPSSLNQIGKSVQPRFSYPYLDADRNYYFALTATNSAGTSPKCEPFSVTTPIRVTPHLRASGLKNYTDIVIEAYLPNGKLAGSFRSSDITSVTNSFIAEQLKFNNGTFEVFIKDRKSGKLLESKHLTITK